MPQLTESIGFTSQAPVTSTQTVFLRQVVSTNTSGQAVLECWANTNTNPSVAKVVTIALGGTIDVATVNQVTIDGPASGLVDIISKPRTGETFAQLTARLAKAIAAESDDVTTSFTTAASAGTITITGAVPGVDFTVTRTQPTAGGTTISAVTITTPASGTATMRKIQDLLVDFKSDGVVAGAKLLAEITPRTYPGTTVTTPTVGSVLKSTHPKTMKQLLADANP